MRLAYAFSLFPALSLTFLRREVALLEEQGFQIELLANTRPDPETLHPADAPYLARTTYLRRLGVGRLLSANLRAFAKAPGRYLGCLGLALRAGKGWRVKHVAFLALGALLDAELRRRGLDRLHVHFAYGAAAAAMFARRLTGRSFSLAIHGSDVLLPEPLLPEKLASACLIVSNCEFHVADLHRRFPELRTPMAVCRLGLDLSRPPWSECTAMTSDGPLHILNVARLVPVKDQVLLLRALGLLRDRGVGFTCRIAGEGPERPRLEALIAELGLGEQVELLGACTESRVVELLDWCQVFVLSSRSEGTPVSVMEAMARARAVVSPRITALPELVDEGGSGLLYEPGSAEDLARALAGLAGDRQRTAAMGRAGRELAARRFDLSANTRRLADILDAPECLSSCPEAA